MYKQGADQKRETLNLKTAVRKLRIRQLNKALKSHENHEFLVHTAAENNNSLALRYLHFKVPTILQILKVSNDGSRSVLSSATQAGKLRCAKYILKADREALIRDDSDFHPLLLKQEIRFLSSVLNASKRKIQEYIIKNYFSDLSLFVCNKYLTQLFHDDKQAQAKMFVDKMLSHQKSTRILILKYVCEFGSIIAIENSIQVIDRDFSLTKSVEIMSVIISRLTNVESEREAEFFFGLINRLNADEVRLILDNAIRKAVSKRDNLQTTWFVKIAFIHTVYPDREVSLQSLVEYLEKGSIVDFIYLFEIHLQTFGKEAFISKSKFLMRLACKFGKLSFVKYLVKNGIEFDQTHDRDLTPYQDAVAGDKKEVVMWCDIYRGVVLSIRNQLIVKAIDFISQNSKMIEENSRVYLEFTDEFEVDLETIVKKSGSHNLLIHINFCLYYPYRDSAMAEPTMISTSLFPTHLSTNQIQFLTHLMLNNLCMHDNDLIQFAKDSEKITAPHMHTLDLSSNGLTARSLPFIGDVLKRHESVVKLNLANNNIAFYYENNEKKYPPYSWITKSFFVAISMNKRFKQLDLSCNRISFVNNPNKFTALIENVLAEHPSLECVNLSGNYIEEDVQLPQRRKALPFLRIASVQKQSYFLNALHKTERVKYQSDISDIISPTQAVFILIAYQRHLACLIETINDFGQSSFYRADLVYNKENKKEGRLRLHAIDNREILCHSLFCQHVKSKNFLNFLKSFHFSKSDDQQYLEFFHHPEIRNAKVKVVPRILAEYFIMDWRTTQHNQSNGKESELIPYEPFADGVKTHNCSTYLTRTLVKFGIFNSEDEIHKSFNPDRALGMH